MKRSLAQEQSGDSLVSWGSRVGLGSGNLYIFIYNLRIHTSNLLYIQCHPPQAADTNPLRHRAGGEVSEYRST